MREAGKTGAIGDAAASGSHSLTWLCCATLLILSAVLTWWPQGLETWRYDRVAIAAGETWRLATGHLVHVGATHFALNLLGLVLMKELLWDGLQARHGFALMTTSAIVIDLALWYRYPGVDWYAGLSGVLHGLWAGCALIGLLTAGARCRRIGLIAPGKMFPWLINGAALLLLCAKIWVEHRTGPIGGADARIGASVVFAAHWYGAIAGVGYALLLFCFAGTKQRI